MFAISSGMSECLIFLKVWSAMPSDNWCWASLGAGWRRTSVLRSAPCAWILCSAIRLSRAVGSPPRGYVRGVMHKYNVQYCHLGSA